MSGLNAQPPERRGEADAKVPSSLLQVVRRYSLSTAGPAMVSAAHFLASLVFLRNLSAHEFGLFSFVMVVVSFGMSLSGALIVVPINQSLLSGDTTTRPACFRMNWLVVTGFALVLALALWVSEAPLRESLILGLYGAVFAGRWFARSLAYIDGRAGVVIVSDTLYSLLLMTGLIALVLAHRLTFQHGSEALLLAGVVSLLPFGRAFFASQIEALRQGSFRDYLPVFRDVSRWAVIGVIFTEVTVNIHAYLVTFYSGADAFALLALGMLLMRPAALVQSSLPDRERPAMARAIARGDHKGVAAMVRYFFYGICAVWMVNIVLCVGLLEFFPELVLKKGYSAHDVIIVVAISAVIMLLRALRTPLAVLLQAAGEFKALAGLGVQTGMVSLVATATLLLAFGPIASMGGVLIGEVVVVARCAALVTGWKRKARTGVVLKAFAHA
jgi:O-antigen/teichoic acid export membrane protein